mgnify:CR=1 FL=1
MIGFTFGKSFLILKYDMFDDILSNLFLDLEIYELTEENKSQIIDSFMDNYLIYLEPIFEDYFDLNIKEDDIDKEELNAIFNEFEEYLDWILKNK